MMEATFRLITGTSRRTRMSTILRSAPRSAIAQELFETFDRRLISGRPQSSIWRQQRG